MSLNPDMIFTAVEIRNQDGAIGTGFLMSVKSETTPNRWPYVITAEHVVRGETDITVAAPDPNRSGELYDPEPINDWQQPIPGLDLAVSPWPFKPGLPYKSVDMEHNLYPLSEERISMLGAPVHYIGLFAPARRMMARGGTFGAIDAKGISHHQGFGYDYDCHLIDCRSYGGFSGSPCFVELVLIEGVNDAQLNERGIIGLPKYRALMCGMFTEHYDDSDDEEANPDGAISRYGVGVMVRGEDIKKALLSDSMKQDRLDREAALVRNPPKAPPTPKVAKTKDASEFETFKSFARDLIQTPKSDIDEVHRGHQ